MDSKDLRLQERLVLVWLRLRDPVVLLCALPGPRDVPRGAEIGAEKMLEATWSTETLCLKPLRESTTAPRGTTVSSMPALAYWPLDRSGFSRSTDL